MPTLTEIFPENAELIEQITRQDLALARELLERFTKPPPTREPWQWVIAQVYIKTPTVSGPFEPTGREYMRELINNINDDTVAEETACMGTGAGKTTINICQALWGFEHDPFSGLYVMPAKDGEGGARHFNNGSMIPSIENTEIFKVRIPTGADRHNFSGLHLEFAGNNLGFVGANSPTQLGAKRCRVIFLDEQDKYKEKLGREAGADYLANERTKQVPNKKVLRKSTPTRENAGIWPHLMRSDLRRRFLPCPHCNPNAERRPPGPLNFQLSTPDLKGWFLLINSPDYTVLPGKFENGTAIPAAALKWDKEARRKDKTWDIDRVIRSTRFECPHCGGHIRDHHRLWLDKHGHWLPTRTALLHKGYHLSSYYTPHVDFDSSWGGMAKKFLDKYEDGSIGGYINSDLAEVHASQEHGSLEINSSATLAQLDWTALMTVDFQKLWPFLWFLIQKWSSFKLHPPLPITNGRPYFIEHFATAPELKHLCDKMINGHEAAWFPLAELLRFDTRTGQWPLLEWCLAQNLTGENLVQLFRDRCNADTLALGRYIYNAMGVRMPKGGDSEIIAAGHCEMSGDDAWLELHDLQNQFQVGQTLTRLGIHPNNAVLIDAGYAEEHNPEVLRKCFESGSRGRFEFYDPMSKKFVKHRVHQFVQPVPVDGWIPFKGYPISKRWRSGGMEREWHFAPDDPFKGTSEAGKYTIATLEAASDLYFHRWMDSRDRQAEIQKANAENRPYRGNIWNLSPDLKLFPENRFTREQFNAQMNSRGRNSDGEIWERGSGGGGKRRHPDHLNDCARNQYPLAESLGFFSYEPNQKPM